MLCVFIMHNSRRKSDKIQITAAVIERLLLRFRILEFSFFKGENYWLCGILAILMSSVNGLVTTILYYIDSR